MCRFWVLTRRHLSPQTRLAVMLDSNCAGRSLKTPGSGPGSLEQPLSTPEGSTETLQSANESLSQYPSVALARVRSLTELTGQEVTYFSGTVDSPPFTIQEKDNT